MLESAIEKRVTEHAKEKGWLVFKWVSPGVRGVPDRILFKKGKTLCIEFKQPGEKPDKHQQFVMDKLMLADISTEIVDSVESGIEVINAYT